MRLAGTKLAANHQYRGFGDQLYDLSGQRPSLDLNFANTKSLVDATTGQNLVTFTRASSGTYVDSQGVIRTATANEARFDHAPTTGESLGLLVEESRTNLLLQSNGFDTTWTNASSSETTSAGTAPDGTNTAWELKDTLDAVATTHSLSQTYAGFTSGTSYSFSVWAKPGTLGYAALLFPATAFTTGLAARFNLTTGAPSGVSAGVTATSVLFNNGWYKCTVTATATSTTSGIVSIRTSQSNSSSYVGDGTGTILIYGAQLEAGSFPTSYIPTTTATVTRSADVASITGSNFSSWYRQDEGTVFAEGSSANLTASAFPVFAGFSVDANNRLSLSYITATLGGGIVNSGGVTSAQGYPSVTVNPRKGAFNWSSSGSYSVVFNSGAATTFAGTYPVGTFNQLTIGNSLLQNTSNNLNGTIRRLTYFPVRLANETLQRITQ